MKFRPSWWTTPIAASLCLLCSCSTAPETSGRTDRAPANLRQECSEPDRFIEDGPLREGDLVNADAKLAGQYKECAKRVKGWIEWEAGRAVAGTPPAR